MKKLVITVSMTITQYVAKEGQKELKEFLKLPKEEIQKTAEEMLQAVCGTNTELEVTAFDCQVIDMVEKLG